MACFSASISLGFSGCSVCRQGLSKLGNGEGRSPFAVRKFVKVINPPSVICAVKMLNPTPVAVLLPGVLPRFLFAVPQDFRRDGRG
jgi:hypothetical protein